MPCRGLVNVSILVDGKALQEYPDPDGVVDTDLEQVRYIEVKAGQKFAIEVRWMAGFKFHAATHLVSDDTFDNDTFTAFEYSCTRSLARKKGKLKSDHIHLSDCRTKRNDETDRWENSLLTFGALGIGDEANGFAVTPDAIEKLGSIAITYYRGKEIALRTPYINDGRLQKPIEEVSEKLLKGKCIKNTVQYLGGEPCSAPQPRRYDYIPIDGPHGAVHTVIYHYRSRKTLQSLGCIPRSPSPPPDTGLILQRTEEMLKIAKQRERETNLQLMRLREQMSSSTPETRANSIVDLDDNTPTGKGIPPTNTEKEVRVKKEMITRKTQTQFSAIGPDETDGQKDPTAQNGGKRARDENDDEIAETAAPPKAPRVEIDLTEDD